ncbi:MAG TPA: UDP-N-acetylglucosamine 2-epimerase (non-hydrolyzing), partial [Clostridia bacterium]
MEQLKVMTILGTRPEIIRLSACIKAFDRYFDHVLVHTGQNWDYTLGQVFFDELGIRAPDHYLDSAGENLGETIGNIIARSYNVILQEKPDALVLLGDSNSALSAIAAKRLKVPIFHMEAGNRCFDENVPEEINRRIVDHISDINLPFTENSRHYLLAEGVRKEHVFVIGSPMREVLGRHRDRIAASTVLQQLDLRSGEYFLVSAHHEENVDDERHFLSLMNAINYIAGHYDRDIVYSTHPRSWKRIEERGFVFHPRVRQLRPFGFFDYIKLQMNAFCVLSDSGTLPEEASILGFPAVLLRTSTERPEAMDKGAVIIAGIKEKDIVQAVELARAMWDNGEPGVLHPDYRDVNVSTK